jgi:hypothetical protein
MQDRYVGDIGDFAKYSLLRALTASSELRLGIVWCLFADESHNLDGRHTSYLQRGEFRSLDPVLHDRLALIVHSGRRSLKKILRSKILPAETISFDLPIAQSGNNRTNRLIREAHRLKWISKALAATAACDLVFFDPDNGLEIPSIPKHGPKAGKYVFLDELDLFWQRGQSLIIYHHLNRSASVEQQTQSLRKRLVSKFDGAALVRSVLFRRGSCRHFWILGQAAHAAGLKSRVEAMLSSGWSGYFEFG